MIPAAGKNASEKIKAKQEVSGKLNDMVDVRDELNAQKKVKITIPSTELERDPVVVGINGYVFQIKRDEPVEVPQSVLNVLNDAKMTIYKQVKRTDGEGNELVAINAQRHAYQMLQ